MSAEHRLARRCAWFALAAQVAFVVAWIVSGALQDGYSHLEQGISELASTFAEHPWIVRVALAGLGLSLLACAVALRSTLAPGAAASLASGLLALAGVCLGIAGFLPVDCSFGLDPTCGDRFRDGALSWQSEAHVWLGLVTRAAAVLSPFAIWLALRSHPVAPLALGAGVLGVALGVGAFLTGGVDSVADGLLNRLEIGLLQAWVAAIAIGVLDVTTHIESPRERTPLRPKDFFGGHWEGEGEIVLRPLFLGRRFPLRFAFSRDTHWIGEGVWLVVDRSRFRGGWVSERRMVCELQDAGSLRVTAGDMPEGAWYDLGEGGYLIRPYVLTAPLGPVALPLRCRDQHRLAPDGTLLDSVDMHVLGVPVARLQGRARPVEGGNGARDRPPLQAAAT